MDDAIKRHISNLGLTFQKELIQIILDRQKYNDIDGRELLIVILQAIGLSATNLLKFAIDCTTVDTISDKELMAINMVDALCKDLKMNLIARINAPKESPQTEH